MARIRNAEELYKKINDLGYEKYVDYLSDNPENELNLNKAMFASIAEMDLKKAILDSCYEIGGPSMVKDFFEPKFGQAIFDEDVRAKSVVYSSLGTVLSDPRLQRTVGALVNYKNPLLMLMPRKQGSGHQAKIRRYTADTTPGAWVNDVETLTESTGTWTNVTFDYKTLATQGTITRLMLAIGRSITDVMAETLMFKSWSFRDTLDYGIIRGDNTTYTKQPDGLDILIPTSQVIAATPSTGGAALTKTMMDEFIDKATMGGIDFIVASARGRRDVNYVEQSYRRYNMDNKVNIGAGMRVDSWDNIPIVESTNILNTMQCNDTAISAYTGGSETELIGVNTQECWLEFLEPIQVQPLAITTSQNRSFDMFATLAIVIRNYQTCARLVGIISA